MSESFDPDAPAQDGSGIYGLPHSAEEAHVILIPVPWEATTSYRTGTVDGPAAILAASRQVDLHDVETGDAYSRGIHLLEEDATIRRMNYAARVAADPILSSGGLIAGDEDSEALAQANELGAQLNAWVRAETERWLAKGRLVGIVGGDHSVPFGAIEALAERHPGMGVLHLDAHADLRAAYEGFTWSHASIMYNVATRLQNVARIVQVGIRDIGAAEHEFARASDGRVLTHFEPELAALRFNGESWGDQCARIVEGLPHEVYLSFDIDGLDPVYCPHTGTPVPGGLSFAQVGYLLRAVVQSGRRIVGFDLTEVAPAEPPDMNRVTDEWDGNVGARLLYKMIGWALRSRSA